MFAAACATAREFTRPIIISSRHTNGECNAGIGAFVVINDEGWIVTAFHILDGIQQLEQSVNSYNKIKREREVIEADTTLKIGKKKALLGNIKIPSNAMTHYSSWWGGVGTGLSDVHILPEVDLAIGKLIDFDKSKVKNFPLFKDPAKAIEPGTSLCKLGFPFLSIQPTFDVVNGSFILPPGSVPPPYFPLEGILTRIAVLDINDISLALKYIETSSPGLRGQSGGPTFDIYGNIWAIQSKTQHLPLGFGSDQKGNKRETDHLQNQYLHVGLGIHTETITKFLTKKGVSFQLSSN